MLDPDKPHETGSAFDERAVAADLAKLADELGGGSEQDLRRAVAQRLKSVLADGRA